jgi:hypothetical protein
MTDTSTTNESDKQSPGLFWGFLIGVLGAATIFLSVRYFEKHWSTGELMYDIGIAAITVAVLEILLLGSIRKLTLRKTQWDRLMFDLEESGKQFDKRALEINQQLNDIKLTNTQNTVHVIESTTFAIQSELSFVRAKLDEIQKRLP